jgi:putative CocE/NonD family hydrolase
MPDGAVLRTDILEPDLPGPLPTVLMRSPYGRLGLREGTARPYAARGYRVVLQSCRGTGGSTGRFRPQLDEQADGLATLRWIESQPWFDGRLATAGPSYLGYVQWAIAAEAGPSLRALCPHVTMSNLGAHHYRSGTFSFEDALVWSAMVTSVHDRLPGLAFLRARLGGAFDRAFLTLPLADLDRAVLGRRIDLWHDFIEHDRPDDPHWAPADHSDDVARVRVPVTMVTGWYDLFLPEQLADYRALVAAGNPPRLTIGPWTHAERANMNTALRDSIAWLDEHVKGEAQPERAPVRVYLMGAGAWRDLPVWPPPGAVEKHWYLQPSGGFRPEPPGAADASTPFVYDPADPTPVAGGNRFGKSGRCPQARTEARADVLCFTSDVLRDDLDVMGDARAEIRITSDLRYFDVFVRLCDVDARGVSTNVTDGIERVDPARHTAPGSADAVWTVPVRLLPTAYRFRAGHRIRVQVSGGAHPFYVRNLGTGEPLATGTAMRVAHQRVHHDRVHGSSVSLPVVS